MRIKTKYFDIHRSFKFCPLIFSKGGKTTVIRTSFMRHNIEDWENGEQFVTWYKREQVEKFSPWSLAILEINSEKDIEILDTIYTNSVLLGEDGPNGWGIKYATEFHMTNDSKLFPPRPQWEEKGYRPDEYGRWIGPDGDVALPLYEGRMVGQFDFSQKGWVSGKGRTAVWREIPWDSKVLEPQYLVSEIDYNTLEKKDGTKRCIHGLKSGFIDVSSATNKRTMILSLIPNLPCGNKVPILSSNNKTDIDKQLMISWFANTFVFDFVLRKRHGGLSLNWFIIEELPTPEFKICEKFINTILHQLFMLNANHRIFQPYVYRYKERLHNKKIFLPTNSERIRLQVNIDAIAISMFKVNKDAATVILNECDYPSETYSEQKFASKLNPKGFWRVDKEKPPELRHTVLSLVAFHDLQKLIDEHNGDREKGIEAFCNQNSGEGWMLPETIRLADYGLGHDDRAKEYQPVAEKFEPRFYDWQLEQTPEDSWAECERHARNILGVEGFERLEKELRGEVWVEESVVDGDKNVVKEDEQLSFL